MVLDASLTNILITSALGIVSGVFGAMLRGRLEIRSPVILPKKASPTRAPDYYKKPNRIMLMNNFHFRSEFSVVDDTVADFLFDTRLLYRKKGEMLYILKKIVNYRNIEVSERKIRFFLIEIMCSNAFQSLFIDEVMKSKMGFKVPDDVKFSRIFRYEYIKKRNGSYRIVTPMGNFLFGKGYEGSNILRVKAKSLFEFVNASGVAGIDSILNYFEKWMIDDILNIEVMRREYAHILNRELYFSVNVLLSNVDGRGITIDIPAKIIMSSKRERVEIPAILYQEVKDEDMKDFEDIYGAKYLSPGEVVYLVVRTSERITSEKYLYKVRNILKNNDVDIKVILTNMGGGFFSGSRNWVSQRALLNQIKTSSFDEEIIKNNYISNIE